MRHDYTRIARDFLRALRGKRSQAAFSKRLGYRTNVAYTWESGRAFPTAATVFRAAARSGIDVRAALERFYRASPPWLAELDPGSPEGVARLLDDLRGRTSVVELSRACARSRFAVARWLKADAEPRLPDFFLLVEKTSLRLLDFLASFTDVSHLPSLSVAWEELEATRRAAYDVPWTQAVLRALELTEYKRLAKHERGWLARRIGISLEEEQRCLKLLARTGQIRLRRARWELREVLAVDTRRDPQSEVDVRAWWAEVALGRLRAGDPGIFSYNVFAVSEADFQRINDLYRATFRQVRSIIGQSEPSQRVVLFSLQMLALDQPSRLMPDPGADKSRAVV